MAPQGALMDGHKNSVPIFTDNTRGIRCVEGRYVVYSIPPSLPFPSHIVLEKYILRVTDLPDTTFYT